MACGATEIAFCALGFLQNAESMDNSMWEHREIDVQKEEGQRNHTGLEMTLVLQA